MSDLRNRYRWDEIPPHVPPAVQKALGQPEQGEPPVRVLAPGQAVPWRRGQLVLEDGTPLPIGDTLPPDLPLGYHAFYPDQGGRPTRVIVAPERCVRPRGRQWGWAVQLYAARSRRSWGIGDLADLRRLGRWSKGLGAGFLLINPLGAAVPLEFQNASPYYPTSRRFRNPLYLCIEEVPGAERLGGQLERLAVAGRAMNAGPRIDRRQVFRLKDEALRAIWAVFTTDPAFDAFLLREGTALKEFALYCALAQRHGEDWRQWPAEYHRPDGTAVEAFAKEHAAEVAYHQWLQWLLDGQLARAAAELPIVQDLPIGFHPGGADAWAWQDLLAPGITVGAPPDAFNSAGQDWSLPPFVPSRLRAAGYEPLIQTIRAMLRHSGGLRIDHVMGLFRLWWIPEGHGAGDGVYIRYPADDLLGIVALESHRAGAFIVGEDLGTVEPGVRPWLAQRDVLSVRLLWFEETPPPGYPESAMAAVTTHDLPTIAGVWTGADARAQESAGLPRNDDMPRLKRRLAEMIGCDETVPVEEVIERAYGLLAQSPSILLTATLDDAQAVRERPNMPGTVDQWPNWSLPLPETLEAMETAELPRRIARALGTVGQVANLP